MPDFSPSPREESPDFSALLNSSSYTPSQSGGKQAAMGIGAGLLELFQAQKKKKEANAAFPEYQDPQQMQFLSELSQKRKAMETGAEYAAGMNAINASTAGTDQAILQGGAGNIGGTIQGLLQAQRVGQDEKNKVLSNAQAYGLQYNNMYNELLDKIAGRKLQLQLMKSDQARAEWAQKAKDGMANLMGGFSYLGGGGSSGGGFNPMDILSGIVGKSSAAGASTAAGAGAGGSAAAGASGGILDSVLAAAPEAAMLAI